MQVTEKIALDVTEAAALLGVSRPTMYEIMHREDFDAGFKVGRRTKICRSKLEKWVEAQADGWCGA